MILEDMQKTVAVLTLYSGVNNSVSDINSASNSAAANGADATDDDDGGLMNPTALGFWILLGVILFVIVIALSVCYLCPRACKRQRDAHRDAELSAQLQLARAREIERVRAEQAQDSEPLFV